jgi:molecular chaperone DnaK
MTEFYEYGIDLGTTNSCISKYNDSQVRIYKNSDNMSVTPSVVYMAKNRTYVGKSALGKIMENPKTVH